LALDKADYSNIHLALVHFPVYNKIGEVVVSSVTTLDVHDISRISRTYGVGNFYLVTPLKTQKELVERLVGHWMKGYGAEYNPTRKEALMQTRVIKSLDSVIEELTEQSGEKPSVVATGAKQVPNSIRFEKLREKINEGGGSVLLVFGTGWGLERNLIKNADYVLEPVKGNSGFNHLPVRGAIAIILDRLLGRH
jgi:hypothetical protein